MKREAMQIVFEQSTEWNFPRDVNTFKISASVSPLENGCKDNSVPSKELSCGSNQSSTWAARDFPVALGAPLPCLLLMPVPHTRKAQGRFGGVK